MTFCARRLIGVMILAAALPAMASAQPYPTQDIHFICTNPPGSGADVLVRYFASKIQEVSGRTVLVENRPGAGGNIAMELVARSKPDGHTVLVHSAAAVAASMGLFKKPPFPDAGKALAVAATINRQPFMLVVDAGAPYRTAGELTAAMKAKAAAAGSSTSESRVCSACPLSWNRVITSSWVSSAGLPSCGAEKLQVR